MGCQPYQLKVCIRSQTRKWLLQSFVFFWSVHCTFRNGPKFDQSRSPLSTEEAGVSFPFKTWLSLMRWMRCQLVCQMALNATAYFWWTVKNAAGFQATAAHGVFKRALQPQGDGRSCSDGHWLVLDRGRVNHWICLPFLSLSRGNLRDRSVCCNSSGRV